MTYCHKLGSGGWCQSTAPCFPGECKYQSRYTILSTNNTKPAASDEPIILSRCSLRSRLAIESKEREGREALLRENESLRARLAERTRLLRQCRAILVDYLTPSALLDSIDREIVGTADSASHREDDGNA